MENAKVCPQCEKSFTCQHSAECWCSIIELTDLQKIELSKKHSDCLCKECLDEFSKKSTKEVD